MPVGQEYVISAGSVLMLDDSILEFLAAFGEPGGESVVMSPTQVWYNLAVQRDVTDKSAGTVSRRMEKLAEHEFLQRAHNDKFLYH